jgi:hypothetical protein
MGEYAVMINTNISENKTTHRITTVQPLLTKLRHMFVGYIIHVTIVFSALKQLQTTQSARK